MTEDAWFPQIAIRLGSPSWDASAMRKKGKVMQGDLDTGFEGPLFVSQEEVMGLLPRSLSNNPTGRRNRCHTYVRAA